jgi:hypothetical protein
VRGTWSRERVVEAIRDWTGAFGEPPRSHEWAPASARDRGRGLHAARRWQNEYPRWPSTSTVCLLFGTWNDALREAGVGVHWEVRPGRGRAERVAAARRLSAQGLRTAQIASLIGVSPRTVRGYLRASSCRSCDEPVIGDGTLCPACATRLHRQPAWSREELVLAMRTWHAECGHAPRQSEWIPSADPAAKWSREHPRWPSATAARSVFGSWSAALRAAGFTPLRRRWDAEAIVAALQAWAAEHGRAPTKAELDGGGGALPTSASVRRYFGSHAAAVAAAGLCAHGRRWSDDEILELLAAASREGGGFPSSREWPGAAAGLPHEATVRERFGSWGAACARAAALR